MTQDDDTFLSRWARRKAAVRAGAPMAPDAPPPSPESLPPAPVPAAVVAIDGKSAAEEAAEPAPPAPTMEDVAPLTPVSDFSRFMRPDVDPQVRTAAMKKLFLDPRFNVIDEMDTDIMDYGKLENLPASMLRRLVQSRALNLFQDEEPSEDLPPADTAPAPTEIAPPDEDPDLRLQPDDAAGRPGDLPGPDADPGGER